MILGIDPKVDYAFKYLMGRDSTRAILIDVVNNVLGPPAGQEITEIELLNPFNLQETQDDELSVLDIKARDQSGRRFNIEMQMLPYPYYGKRIIYRWSRFYPQQLLEGNDYVTLQPTISISFLNHVLFPKVPDYLLRFHLSEDRHHFTLSDDIEFHVLELPKFTKTLTQLTSGLDIWLYFLRFAEMIDAAALPAELRKPSIVRAVEELTLLTQTDIERERYEARRKAQLDQNSFINAARRQGEQECMEAGRQMGEQVGEQVGAIHLCQQILQLPQTPRERLLALPPEDLHRLAENMKKQALKGQ